MVNNTLNTISQFRTCKALPRSTCLPKYVTVTPPITTRRKYCALILHHITLTGGLCLTHSAITPEIKYLILRAITGRIISLAQSSLNSGEIMKSRNYSNHVTDGGPGSSVGITTSYGLDGPGIKSPWGRDFPHLFRPALGPTQPPVQWVPVGA
jgi:hypothetical protein